MIIQDGIESRARKDLSRENCSTDMLDNTVSIRDPSLPSRLRRVHMIDDSTTKK